LIRNHKLRILDQITGEIHQSIMKIAESSSSLSKDTDQTLSNSAYLIDRAKADDYVNLIAEIKEKYSSSFGLVIHTSGPWPPYSFCSEDLSLAASGDKPDYYPQKKASSALGDKGRYRLLKRSDKGYP